MTKELSKNLETDVSLNDKQQAFVEKILSEQMTAQQAYMSVYKVTSKSVASSNAYKLMKLPKIKMAISSLSNQLKALETVPKSYLIKKTKALLERCELDLDDAGNRKYYIECLDILMKATGAYQHNSTVTKVNMDGKFSFNGWNPDSNNPISITPHEEMIDGSLLENHQSNNNEDTVDWDPESEDIDDGHMDKDEPMPF